MMQLYLVIAYDTPSDKRRRRLFRALKSYGERKQYSVFEARINREQWASLKGTLEKIIEVTEDNLAAYFLTPEGLTKTWRVGNDGIQDTRLPDII